MDIIITTPKSQIANAAREADDCKAAGGGEYYRRFHSTTRPNQVFAGDRVYYVEDGYIRGFAEVSRVQIVGSQGMVCDSTGRVWSQGFYVFMAAASWKWIKPIPMRGFQGFRYATRANYDVEDPGREFLSCHNPPQALFQYPLKIVGNWRDPKPEAST